MSFAENICMTCRIVQVGRCLTAGSRHVVNVSDCFPPFGIDGKGASSTQHNKKLEASIPPVPGQCLILRRQSSASEVQP